MARQIGQIPCHRGVCLTEQVRAIDQGDIIEFCAANALRLKHPEQAGVVQILLGFRRQMPQLFRSRRPLSQPRQKGSGPCDHCRMGRFIELRPRGSAHARLLTRRHSYPSLSRIYAARPLPNQAEAALSGYGRPEPGLPGKDAMPRRWHRQAVIRKPREAFACRNRPLAQTDVEGLPEPNTPFWVNCDIRRSS
ncbi:hypothetical protein ACVWZW_000115 [Bradyrhizobium sp. F1.13.4]